MKELKKGLFGCFLVGLCILFLSGVAEAETFCLSSATELQAALTETTGNDQDDVIHIRGSVEPYIGNFIYAPIEPEPYALTIEGGYTAYDGSRVV